MLSKTIPRSRRGARPIQRALSKSRWSSANQKKKQRKKSRYRPESGEESLLESQLALITLVRWRSTPASRVKTAPSKQIGLHFNLEGVEEKSCNYLVAECRKSEKGNRLKL